MNVTNVHPPSGFEEPIPGYRLTDPLGRGGFGEVWRATAPGGISKAVKLIFSDQAAGRANELDALNRIKDVRHPFLLSIERIEERDGILMIVTELGDTNLQEHYRGYRNQDLPGIPQDELLGMLRDVADALDFIYEEYALQHLDIKPANLLLFGKRVKVADFGLVKNIYERSQSIVGGLTPTYASPEVFDGQPSRASDQYSLAVLYQELLTGVLPFDGASAARLAAQHLREAPNLKSLPLEQQAVIARALSKDPQQRFPSCKALIAALEDAVRRTAANEAAAKVELPFSSPAMLSHKPRRPAAERRPAAAAPTTTTAATIAAPAAGDAVASTIVIGVGGSAATLLQRLGSRLIDRLGEAAAQASVRLMLLDTDSQVLNEFDRDTASRRQLETILTPLRSSAEYRQQGQQHQRWMSRRWLYNIPRNLRTDGLRPLGRLALLSNVARVRAAIQSAIKHGLNATGMASTPRVMLVGSISGGTGSGMLLDLAYLVRSEMQAAGCQAPTVDGVLLHATPLDGGRDKANLNALATLHELQHYSAHGHYYPGEPLLELMPFHGNNQTFRHVDLVLLGQDLETKQWQRRVDDVAELVYARLTTPLDAHRGREANDGHSRDGSTVNVLQVRQIGGYSAEFVDRLTRELCRAVTSGWLGEIVALPPGMRSSSQTATMILNTGKQDRLERLQRVAAEAQGFVRKCGADPAELQSGAHDTLAQDLGADERTWLDRFYEPMLFGKQAVSEADSLVAQKAVLALDQRVGLDFEALPERAVTQTLFEQLRPRLASRAMQVAVRITNWIGDLVDDPEYGIESALAAADACRQTVRELNQSAALELQNVRHRQTSTRIAVTTAPLMGDGGKTGRNWLGGKSRNRLVLEEKLIQLGLLIFDELALVCVDTQLRAIESHISATIDQLQSLAQEVRSLQSQWAESTEADVVYEDQESLAQLLSDNRHRLVAELRQRIEREVLPGPKKLQRFLPQRGILPKDLEAPLHRTARQVVVHCTRRLMTLLLQHGPNGLRDVDINLDAAVQAILDEPWTLPIDQPERTFVLAPKDAAASQFSSRVKPAAGPLVPLFVNTNIVTICREAEAVPLADVMQKLIGDRPGLWTLAENLHTRIDVEWSAPQPRPAADLDAILREVGVSEAGAPIEATIRLTPANS